MNTSEMVETTVEQEPGGPGGHWFPPPNNLTEGAWPPSPKPGHNYVLFDNEEPYTTGINNCQ